MNAIQFHSVEVWKKKEECRVLRRVKWSTFVSFLSKEAQGPLTLSYNILIYPVSVTERYISKKTSFSPLYQSCLFCRLEYDTCFKPTILWYCPSRLFIWVCIFSAVHMIPSIKARKQLCHRMFIPSNVIHVFHDVFHVFLCFHSSFSFQAKTRNAAKARGQSGPIAGEGEHGEQRCHVDADFEKTIKNISELHGITKITRSILPPCCANSMSMSTLKCKRRRTQ